MTVLSWFQSPDTHPPFFTPFFIHFTPFFSFSRITENGPVISFARSRSSLKYDVPGQEVWISFGLINSLFTSLAFIDLFYAPVCSTLSIHKAIVLDRANEGQEFLNGFESIYPRHLLLPFFFLTLQFAPNRILCLLWRTDHCPQVTVYPELLLFWHHLHKSSSTSVLILWFLVMSFEYLSSRRELLWSQRILSIQEPLCFFFIRIVCNFIDKMSTQGPSQLLWDIYHFIISS